MSNEEFDKLAKDYKSVHKKTLKNFSPTRIANQYGFGFAYNF